MLNLAVDGITSFSIKPIRLITVLGMVFVGISLGVLCWIAYCNLIGQVVRGWSSLMLSIWFCTGCVLIALGIVGEYVGKTYMETKERPQFIIQDEILPTRLRLSVIHFILWIKCKLPSSII